MSPFPEEVDVFSVPHSRMKELVNDYADMIKKTNFSSDMDVNLLLESLLKTFMEFKTHEQIENQLIMNKLKQKLKQLSIRNTAVCNCHSDDQLGEMMTFIKSGYQKKTVQDRINYGLRLEKALEEFTCTFIPHMQEEEEIFQPLLLQYFSYEEIRDLKKRVIQQHLMREKQFLDDQLLSEQGSTEKEDKNGKLKTPIEYQAKCDDARNLEENEYSESGISSFKDVPPEIQLKIFSYLAPPDLGQCARVNVEWNQMSKDPSLWPQLFPVQWALGEWDNVKNAEVTEDTVECCDENTSHFSDDISSYLVDDDADIDELMTDEDEYDEVVQQVKSEAEVLRSLVNVLLPIAGKGVKTLVLRNSRALTNGMLNKMIKLCPNLEYLDLSQTRTSDAGLKSIGNGLNGCKLKHVILSGCVGVTDATLIRIAVALNKSDTEACSKWKKDNVFVTKQHPLEASPKMDLRLKNVVEKWPLSPQNSQSSIASKEINQPAIDSGDCLCEMYFKECNIAFENGCNISTHQSEIAIDENIFAPEIDKKPPENVNMSCKEGKNFVVEKETNNKACHSCCVVLDDKDERNKEAGFINSLELEDCISHNVISPLRSYHLSYSNQHKLDFSSKLVSCDKLCQKNFDLQYLNLSGCYQITDVGVGALAKIGIYPKMKHLDLSGCLRLSAKSLHTLVSACPNLTPQKLYYCDNIVDGPYQDIASGCQNLECSKRVCCRSGE